MKFRSIGSIHTDTETPGTGDQYFLVPKNDEVIIVEATLNKN